MKNIIIILLAILAKLLVFYLLINYCIEIYDITKPFYKQNFVVWICFYLPLFMGMESIINLLFSNIKVSNKKIDFDFETDKFKEDSKKLDEIYKNEKAKILFSNDYIHKKNETN